MFGFRDLFGIAREKAMKKDRHDSYEGH